MRKLYLDIETYSPEPIGDAGHYRYAMHPEFDILLVAYAFDDEPVQVLDLASGEAFPQWLLNALFDPSVAKVAHNATFERVCFSTYLWKHGELRPNFAGRGFLDPMQWRCTMIQAVRCGLPQSLKQVGEALGLEQQKMKEGKNLIKVFCTPHDEGVLTGRRVMPEDAPEDWEVFKAYCRRDVEVEREIDRALEWYEVSPFEQELYAVDQDINDRGVLVDLGMAKAASTMDALVKARLNREAMALTGLSNPNSPTQLKDWLGERLGRDVDTIRKDDLSAMESGTDDPTVRRVLAIRKEMGKTSCTKYDTMLAVAGSDGRARGLTQFYGTRTGRWAGRLIQMQNLPQNHIEELAFAREAAKAGDLDTLELCFGNVPDTLSQLIRTAFIAPERRTLAVCDFSAIEARVLAWEAGESWVLDAFRAGKDIYCETASQMFGVPVEKHGRNAHLRQKGKIAVLALGYGGGPAALDKMGGSRMGLSRSEEEEIVRMWRKANDRIVKYWSALETAVRSTLAYRCASEVNGMVSFTMHDRTLCCTLPSGRVICYPEMEVFCDRLRFMGLNQTTKKWEWTETYGGKLTENITQAIARDCLAAVMVRLERNCPGIDIVFHIHDEIVAEVSTDHAARALEIIQGVFAKTPGWAEGLPLKGAGYTTPFYMKD